jgi:acylphosphatase
MTDQVPMTDQAPDVRLTAFVHGQVQGVGFRWWTRARALELGLRGSATNLPDGRVQVIAEGPAEQCDALIALLRGGTTPGSVALVVTRTGETRGEVGFRER